MRIHVLQHVPFEGLASILPWAQAQGATITTTKFFESANLPHLSEFDVLIALGGPMSVNDEASLPWLRDEKRFVRETIDSGKPVLGICLGAQLMASSFGADVYPGPNKEIGWFPVISCSQNPDSFVFPAGTEVFHWHGETFDLPSGAIHLAKSEACFHQAFQVGARAIGLQFHLETTPQSAADILFHCHNELVPAKFVQSEQELRSSPASRYSAINTLMENVLSYITRSEA
jgi:GMP synthase-like glutamine amidotransferase